MRKFIVIIGLAVLVSVLAMAAYAIPEGATVVVGRQETRASQPVNNVTADAGNVTEVNISASSQTLAWQGFYGEVNGSIVLEDASGDLFYSWNITNISGEIYASLDATVVFANINPDNNCSQDNWLTSFELADSANNTFTSSSNRQVQVGNVIINASTACAAYTYVNDAAQSSVFHELVLTSIINNATNASVGGNNSIYTTIINKDTTGFDGATHDYQLLVPVNRTAGFNSYAFYAELG